MLDRLGRVLQGLCLLWSGYALFVVNWGRLDEVLLALVPLGFGWACRYVLSGSASLVPWK